MAKPIVSFPAFASIPGGGAPSDRKTTAGPPWARRAIAAAMLLATGPAMLAAQALAASHDCVAAAHRAAQVHGVPEEILLTIATIESGRGNEPGWPWTVGHSGTGFWAETRTEALDHARTLLAAGERNLDLGCFQINLYWHAADFASLEAMIDPDTNAGHAAHLLAEHHARTGDWEAAVAAFHSRTPALAARYLERFRAAWGQLRAPEAEPPQATARGTAPAALALLHDTAAAQSAGSLVRAGHLGQRLIGGTP